MVDANPKAQKNLSLTITKEGGVAETFEAHVSSVKWTPSRETLTWRGGTPDAVFTDTTAPTWAAEVVLVQDWDTPGSLFNFLLDNEGAKADAVYKPDAAGDFGISAEITLVAPDIGGAVNAFNESTVTMGSTKPERVVAP